MKIRKLATLCIAFAIALPGISRAQNDPVGQKLISPQLAMEHAEKIGLTKEQKTAIEEAAGAAHEQSKLKMPAVEEASAALLNSLDGETIDEAATLKCLNALLDSEPAVKRIHFMLLVKVNNILTKQQRDTLNAMRAKSGHPDASGKQQRLEAKLKRVQEAVQEQSDSGSPPLAIVQLMQKFPDLMKQGKHKEAESVLDEALQRLGKGDSDAQTPAPPKPETSKTSAEIRSEIDRLRVKDVAWRKIEWKTCLLDGLKASKEQNKPVILWVFIDLPINDKRC